MNTNEEEGQEHQTPHELIHVKEFLSRYGARVALWLAVVVVVVVVPTAVKKARVDKATRASELFAAAATIQDLESLVANYASAEIAPAAMIRLAKAYFSADRYDIALSKYEEFLARFPGHEFAPAAELGISHSMEALGRYGEALRAFLAFIEQRGGHYLLPQALLGEVRCLYELGKDIEAEEKCAAFLAAYPGSHWSPRFEETLSQISRERRRRSEGRQNQD